MYGKEIRKMKLFSIKGSSALIVPMDHGITSGPIEGLKEVKKTITSIRNTATGIIMHKGIYKSYYKDIYPIPFVLHLSASTINSSHPERKVLVSTVKEAVYLGAYGVSMHINIGNDYEEEMLKDLGRISTECNEYGMPLIAMIYPRGKNIEDEFDAEKVAHCVRIGEELGADIIKTNYTGSKESFRKITESTSIPILIAGGKKMDTPQKVYSMVKDAMQAGARGVSIGRNIFQNPNPSQIVTKIYEIIWEETVDDDEDNNHTRRKYR